MKARVVAYALCMLATGSINTIATKFQDMTELNGVPFQHPAFQSACMFLGESLCLIPYYILRWRRRHLKARLGLPPSRKPARPRSFYVMRALAFLVPTLCDATATMLLNIGLFYTFASTYQMLRGTLVLFAGMFTILILRRTLYTHHWVGLVLIMAGAAIVGAASVLHFGPSPAPVEPTSYPPPDSLLPAWAAAAHAQQAQGASVLGHSGGLAHDPAFSHGMPAGGPHRSEWSALTALTARGLKAETADSQLAWPSSHAGAWVAQPAGVVGGILVPPREQASPQEAAGRWHAAGGQAGSGWRVHSGSAPHSPVAPLFGDMMVILAQVFAALQFILEEKFLGAYRIQPLLAVGLEGMWGVLLCVLALPVLAHVKMPNGQAFDDPAQAIRAMIEVPELRYAVLLSVASIGVFNFTGLSVTAALSGASRATIDACRTLLVWLFSLAAGWEPFRGLQLVGFVVLLSGSSLYNEILRSCLPLPQSLDTGLAGDVDGSADGVAGDSDTDDKAAQGAAPRNGRSYPGWGSRPDLEAALADTPSTSSLTEPLLPPPGSTPEWPASPARGQAPHTGRGPHRAPPPGSRRQGSGAQLADAGSSGSIHSAGGARGQRSPAKAITVHGQSGGHAGGGRGEPRPVTMARSIRLGYNVLSPHDMVAQMGDSDSENDLQSLDVMDPMMLAATPYTGTPYLGHGLLGGGSNPSLRGLHQAVSTSDMGTPHDSCDMDGLAPPPVMLEPDSPSVSAPGSATLDSTMHEGQAADAPAGPQRMPHIPAPGTSFTAFMAMRHAQQAQRGPQQQRQAQGPGGPALPPQL